MISKLNMTIFDEFLSFKTKKTGKIGSHLCNEKTTCSTEMPRSATQEFCFRRVSPASQWEGSSNFCFSGAVSRLGQVKAPKFCHSLSQFFGES